MLSYISKHWEGKLSLSISFWINLILINIGVRVLSSNITEVPLFENPVVNSRFVLIYAILLYIFIYPWQVIGLWRSASRHIKENKLWPTIVKIIVVISLLVTLITVGKALPIYTESFRIAVGENKEYQIELDDTGSLIHLRGSLSFGVSEDVRQLLYKHQSIKGIILDSVGGRVYEGKELSKIILINGLDTYSLEGCFSACTNAFISGNRRYLAKGANLGFHQYRPGNELQALGENLESRQKEVLKNEQQKTLLLFQRRGVSQNFINKIFQAEKDDLWYPNIDEMLKAKVIHEIIGPSIIKLSNHMGLNRKVLEQTFKESAVWQTIKKYEPAVYEEILTKMEEQLAAGASVLEIQQSSLAYLKKFGENATHKTSNKALIRLVRLKAKGLGILGKIDPILCMKEVFPEKYGALVATEYLPSDYILKLSEASSALIIDSYKPTDIEFDFNKAKEVLGNAVSQLGDDATFLDHMNLQNKSDYTKACNAIIRFYELILLNGETSAGNGLRYIFSPQLR